MNIVITGAGGFLATEVLRQLGSFRDISILAVTSKNSLPSCGSIDSGRLRLIQPGDFVSDSRYLDEADLLLNCAFPRCSDGASLASGMLFLSKVFTMAAGSKVGAVINISSQSVYAQNRDFPANEATVVCLESKYAVAKYSTELYLSFLCADTPYTNVRLASLIGPGFDQRLVNKMIAKAVADHEIKVVDSASRFGFFDVRDAADALIKMVHSDPLDWKEIYVLGSLESYTLIEIAEAVATVYFEKFGESCSIVREKRESAEICSACDSSLFSREFAWSQKHSLYDSVSYIFEDAICHS